MSLELLFGHEVVHLILTTLVVLSGLYIAQKSRAISRKSLLAISLGAFVGGLAIDIDHLFDYFLAYGFNFRLDYFLTGRMFEKLQKTYVILHAWEWVVIIAIVAWFTKNRYLKYFLASLAVAMITHLAYDTYFHHYHTFGYSIINRAIYNFDFQYFTYSH